MNYLIVNGMTLLRIVAAAGMVLGLGSMPVFTGWFIVGLVSDVLDGWLARLLHAKSKAGELFDTVADGIFLLTAAVCFWQKGFIPVMAVVAYVIGCQILGLLTHPKYGQRLLPVSIWARIGLAWFWFAVVLDCAIVVALIWYSYPPHMAGPLTLLLLIPLQLFLRGPVAWRDGCLKALAAEEALLTPA